MANQTNEQEAKEVKSWEDLFVPSKNNPEIFNVVLDKLQSRADVPEELQKGLKDAVNRKAANPNEKYNFVQEGWRYGVNWNEAFSMYVVWRVKAKEGSGKGSAFKRYQLLQIYSGLDGDINAKLAEPVEGEHWSYKDSKIVKDETGKDQLMHIIVRQKQIQ